jgi:hypothetical protein
MKSGKTGLIDKTATITRNPAVRARLGILLELAVAIGKREGILTESEKVNIEKRINITDSNTRRH